MEGPRLVSGSSPSAFSLIEIMIVMGLLSVMVLGLMAMFNQTQRAFRLGMSQTDVLEAGRLTSGMFVRELEQITPSYANAVFNSPGFLTFILSAANTSIQPLPGGTAQRFNVMEDLFFLNRENQTWTGIGYFVRTNNTFPAGNGFGPVGTLYRYATNNTVAQFRQNPSGLRIGFLNAIAYPTNASKIVDGVVHFRIRAFDRNGQVINFNNTNVPVIIRFSALQSPFVPSETVYGFNSNAVPAFVEVELGILEQQTLEHYKSIPVYTAQTNYLAGQAPKVHLFRQRIAVRNVDPSAYQ